MKVKHCNANDRSLTIIVNIVAMGSSNDRRRNIVTSSLIGWTHTQNDSCNAMPHNSAKYTSIAHDVNWNEV